MNARPRTKSWLRAPVNAYRNCVAFHMPSCQLAEAPAKNVKTDTIWRPIIQRQAGVNMYGGSYVVNLFTQRVITKSDIFATAILHNNLFCHRLSDGRHCTSRPFTYVLRKDMSTLYRRLKCTPFRKNVLNEISRKSNLNRTTWLKFCDRSFTIVTPINCFVI